MGNRVLAGRYELIEKIGEGGMAVVYKARCRLLNRYVAVKILRPEFTKDAKFIESFRRESQSAASLAHPNIVNVYDVGKEGNIHYIVMELIEGRVLSDIIKQEGPMEPRRVVSISKQIASALGMAHRNNIIHRDVKPHNILLTEDGIAKITDFGIAKAISSGTIVGKQTGTIMGSVHYFSPEQARGGYIDEKSDLYSLGIVMYEMLTGRVPFDADNPVAVAVMHMNDEIIPPSGLVGNIPADLENIVMRATSKIQVNRYRSADEMVTALNLIDYHRMAGGETGSRAGEAMSNTIVMPAVRGQQALEKRRESVPAADEEEMGNEKMAKGKKKKFRFNKIKVAAIIAALLCAIPVSGLLYSGINSLFEAKEVSVPNLKGLTQERAEADLEKLGLKLDVKSQVISSDYEEGEIVSQDPEEGNSVQEGTTISVNISKGMRAGAVPNLVGKSQSDAEFLLETYGYEVGTVTEANNDYPSGVVFEQSPKAGEEAKSGTKVSFKISLGSKDEELEMPNLQGLDIDKAKTQITKYKLSLGDVKYEASSSHGKNKVITQSVSPGETIVEGKKIDLVVSSGSAEDSGDDNGGTSTGSKEGSVSLTISYSKAQNDAFWMTVIVSDENGVSTPISRELRDKNNGSETISISGVGSGTVTIMFDNEITQKLNVDFGTGEVK